MLSVNAVPALRFRFITYGSRATASSVGSRENSDRNSRQRPQQTPNNNAGHLQRLLDGIGAIQVPHSYFKHFYILSVLSSIFWSIQLLARSRLLLSLCEISERKDRRPSMSMDQVLLTSALMTLQGARRFVESSTIAKPSLSKMWFGHWLLGMAFYLAMGVAVWIEGSGRVAAWKACEILLP